MIVTAKKKKEKSSCFRMHSERPKSSEEFYALQLMYSVFSRELKAELRATSKSASLYLS